MDFNVSPNLIGVDILPHAVRMSVGLQTPLGCLTPGAVHTPFLGCFNAWLMWTISGERPWQPWHHDASRGNLFPFIIESNGGYVGGLEEIGVSDAVNSMLLITTSAIPGGDATAGVLRFFPVWWTASGGNASFTGLLAKGGFECSASFNNDTNTVSGVVIVAKAAARCAVLSPWKGSRSVRVTDTTESGTPKEIPVAWGKNGEGVFAFDARAGGSYTIEQQRPLKTDDGATLSKLMKLVVVVAPHASSDSLNASVFLAAWIPRVATSDFASAPLRIMTPAAAKGMAQVAVGVAAVAALGISAADLSSAAIGMEGFL